jgi:lysophospholipase L1-like esterase
MTKLRTGVLLTIYCVALLLLFDFIYTKITLTVVRRPFTADPVYSHSFQPNFSGQMRWGSNRYNMFTNSLGFRDASVREIPNESSHRRVLVIGDSFTEGLGLLFEDTFAGKLFLAGQAADDKTEFLNAGVSGYSPTIYYAKIKHFLERGLKFDEVIVASDISDVQEEATLYFCIDEVPEYRARCSEKSSAFGRVVRAGLWDFDPRDTFAVSDVLVNTIKHYLYWYTGVTTYRIVHRNVRAGWTIPGSNVGDFAPLGVEGGIERSRRHMQALADLLSARGIPLTIVVYPWPVQLYRDDRDSRQVRIWQDFCVKNCKQFINAFPRFFTYKDAHPNWYDDLFIRGDVHFSKKGAEFLYEEIAKRFSYRQ